jgi:hypothetical protein
VPFFPMKMPQAFAMNLNNSLLCGTRFRYSLVTRVVSSFEI